ncbi:MAG: hypothetical protein HFG32_06470 [Eubacterium sp.]|nr:hypothetical protein [Eubacterium sp.]
MTMFNTSMADALFGGSKSVGTGSFFSASNFGDLALIKSGVYTKMMRSYVSKMTEGDETEKSSDSAYKFKNSVSEKMEQLTAPKVTTETDKSNKVLSNIKSASYKLETSANALSNMDFDKSTREELYDAAKSFVADYNSVLSSAKDTDNVSLSRSVKWMKDDIKAREKMMAKIGITIGSDGALSIDEEKFNEANLSDIRTQFSGSSSIVGKTAQRATGLYNLAANQISFNGGNTFYSSKGVLK